MRENKTCPHQGWQQTPTVELDQILQAELVKEHPDKEVVLSILHELEKREQKHPFELTLEVPEVINKLSKCKAPYRQSIHKRRWIGGIAAAMAIVCILAISVSPTVRAEGIFDALYRWTNSIFEFINPDQTESYPIAIGDFITDNPGLQQLHDKLCAFGVTEQVVPMWLPDGFKLEDLKEMPILGGTKIYSKFVNADNSSITITYRLSSDITTKFEKEDSAVQIYDYSDINHFIMVNDNSISVKWTIAGVECSFVASIPKESVYEIIKSIYRRSLP